MDLVINVCTSKKLNHYTTTSYDFIFGVAIISIAAELKWTKMAQRRVRTHYLPLNRDDSYH